MKALSIWQWVRKCLDKWYILYPEKCAICDRPTMGNKITGYYFSCSKEHNAIR